MKNCVIGKGEAANKMANAAVNKMLQEYSRELGGFTRSEFDKIFEYDVLRIMAFFYAKMNAEQKQIILAALEEEFSLYDMEGCMEAFCTNSRGNLYVPLSCRLIDRLGDGRVTSIIYQSLFKLCRRLVDKNWNQNNSFSNYLVLLNSAYFTALSYILHLKEACGDCIQDFYGQGSYDDLIESFYEKHSGDLYWDNDVELDVLDELISESREKNSYEDCTDSECSNAVDYVDTLFRNHIQKSDEEKGLYGFDLIVYKTGIREKQCIGIQGFECHFCEAKASDEEYIIIYQKEAHIKDIVDDVEKWSAFQRDVYHEDIRQNDNRAMVYIIYILDGNSDNIPIQIIESNRTYGRKYVFTEEETITFINGIVKTSADETGTVSPVQEWDRILREEHLTGCLVEPYAAKKVESYLLGQRFDADYGADDDYARLQYSKVSPVKWVKSLDTTGFRDFCFNQKDMSFGQINLFYGANGSGKTSVLEAIEYALTSEVRRVKDFKVKLPSEDYPKLQVYDKEAGIHTLTPEFSKANSKEIERVWYGVPVGRNKSTLNDSFNKFNSFDSEAAYKFIHESDNSEDSFSSMFGNLMFGESVVDHEKKWQRFKKAFEDRYAELRQELSDAKSSAALYEASIAQKSDNTKAEEIETKIRELKLAKIDYLPDDSLDRYAKILEELESVRKYVGIIFSNNLDKKTFQKISEKIAQTKHDSLEYVKEKRETSEKITKIADDNGAIKKRIFDERKKQEKILERKSSIDTDINNWRIVQNVLDHKEAIKLAYDLEEESEKIDKELYYISKIEQRTAIVKFLKSGKYCEIPQTDFARYERELSEVKARRQLLESQYAAAKEAFGEKEQKIIELRKIGKTLLTDSRCPLCGHEYDSSEQLVSIIDDAIVVDAKIDSLITEIQKASNEIKRIEQIIESQRLILKAKEELSLIKGSIPMIEKCGTNYFRLNEYVDSKAEKEKRKEEIVEQQAVLDRQGFSLHNIQACQNYKTTDFTYRMYLKSGDSSYDVFLQKRLDSVQEEEFQVESAIAQYEKQLRENAESEEILQSDIHWLETKLASLDVDANRELEQALENLKNKFNVEDSQVFGAWGRNFNITYDKVELEVSRLESQGMLGLEKQWLAEYKATIKRDEPMVERCARAIQTFEKMPTLSAFVEKSIKNNIQQISKFFKWMHHSGEFEQLDIDENGIYAVRGMNHQVVRTYEMSTGQRSTIAMAVMFALHMAAPDAPQFLLLDEPLATMDDTQVQNVLDILKSLAEQNTQIFFTTANGIMINMFKECFKNTPFDYKEYQFIKRVNRPSEIKETSINDTKSIEELTLDDLTLDYHQFAQIREILRKNQEKLVSKDEWEITRERHVEGSKAVINPPAYDANNSSNPSNFFDCITGEEQRLLLTLMQDDGKNATKLRQELSVFPSYKMMFESINEKAIDFFGETVVENNDELPWIGEDYQGELLRQYEKHKS